MALPASGNAGSFGHGLDRGNGDAGLANLNPLKQNEHQALAAAANALGLSVGQRVAPTYHINEDRGVVRLINRGTPTFGNYDGPFLSDSERKMLYGIASGRVDAPAGVSAAQLAGAVKLINQAYGFSQQYIKYQRARSRGRYRQIASIALTAVTAGYVGPQVLNPISQASTIGGIAAHAAWGGIQGEITGGDFVSGALAGGFGKATTIGLRGIASIPLRGALTVVVGATGSYIGGGNPVLGGALAGLNFLSNELTYIQAAKRYVSGQGGVVHQDASSLVATEVGVNGRIVGTAGSYIIHGNYALQPDGFIPPGAFDFNTLGPESFGGSNLAAFVRNLATDILEVTTLAVGGVQVALDPSVSYNPRPFDIIYSGTPTMINSDEISPHAP